MTRKRRLRRGAEPQCLGGQHEIADIGAAIDRAVDAERLVGMNNRDMRRAEEIVILQRLFCVGGLVAARDAQRVVKLEAALAAALQINPEIFAGGREIMPVLGARSCFCIDQFAETFLGLAAGDHYLPRLAVAPRCRALRHVENMLDGLARLRVGPERAHGVALVQQLFEHADAFFGRVARLGCVNSGIRHDYRPLVGILLNGTSLSTRMSPGRPSTRSAMTLRRISSVPPAMRIEGEDSSICWNWPRASSSAAPVKTPAAPSRSIAYIAISCSIDPATNFPIEFSGPGRSPFDSAEIAR